MSGIYINKRDTIILLSVLLLINPFIACLSSILFLKMGNQHIRVCAFFIAIFIGLLAFTQYSPNGDISRTYHMINSVTDFSLGSFLTFILKIDLISLFMGYKISVQSTGITPFTARFSLF